MPPGQNCLRTARIDEGRSSRNRSQAPREAIAHVVAAVEDEIAPSRLQLNVVENERQRCTLVHFAMQLHPSTQSCRVICVRDGILRSSASE